MDTNQEKLANMMAGRLLGYIASAADSLRPGSVTPEAWGTAKIMAGTALGVFAATEIFERVKAHVIDPRVNAQLFQQMLEKHPRLASEKPEQVADLWKTLYRTAPHLAGDPTGAGAFIIQQLNSGTMDNYGGPMLQTYDALSKVQAQMAGKASNSPFQTFAAQLTPIMGQALSTSDKQRSDAEKVRQQKELKLLDSRNKK
jgi:uncharacterized protein YneF (UPF0154 family)